MLSSLLCCCFASYLILVRVLRFRRVNSIGSRYAKDALKNMSPLTAQRIAQESLFYDTPMFMLLGTQIALFKVYAIPTVASLLLKTGELKSDESLNKRLADTATLIATSISNPLLSPGCGIDSTSPSYDPRAAIAIARINYLHSKYRISNDDFLYNLALFMLEPTKWTAKFDWRPHSPIEREAIFVLWTDIGRRMGIKDIWSSFEEMEEWAARYEEEKMVPSDESEKLARVGIDHFLSRVPEALGLRALVFQLMLTVLDQRTRTAMRLPDPSPSVSTFIHGLFALRAFIVRHFCLPRRKPALWVPIDSNHHCVAGVARMSAVYQRRSGPWYYPEKKGLALTIQNIQIALGLRDASKVPGKRWRSDGYRLEELGPIRFEKEGHEQVMRNAAEIQGCPVTGPWAAVPKAVSES